MAKKSKKKKNKNKRAAGMFGTGATAVVASEIIGNALGQVLADGLERYFAKDGAGKKKLKKSLKKLTSRQNS